MIYEDDGQRTFARLLNGTRSSSISTTTGARTRTAGNLRRIENKASRFVLSSYSVLQQPDPDYVLVNSHSAITMADDKTLKVFPCVSWSMSDDWASRRTTGVRRPNCPGIERVEFRRLDICTMPTV